MDKIGKKSYHLDPIPASIFEECKLTLLPILTNMVNMSLQLNRLNRNLKKDNLDFEDYPNFRP